jgi:RNA recognition motif-containing protein
MFVEGSRDPQRVLVVRNILATTTEETLKNFFSAYGNVVSVTLLGRALAFIEFERPASTAKVLQVETPVSTIPSVFICC